MTVAQARNASVILLAGILAGVSLPAQGGCPSLPPFVPVQPPVVPPLSTPLIAVVDPLAGDDVLAAVGTVAPYKTIGAAVAALTPLVATPGVYAVIRLMPGLYGFGAGAAQSIYNGDRWPLFIPPGICLRGDSALRVFLDGAALDPAVPGLVVPDPLNGTPATVHPVLVFGGPALGGYEHTVVSRLSIVRAEVGVLIGGAGEIEPTFGHVLFTGCHVGAQVHSLGAAPAGVHRPRFVWCTFGGNDLGFAATGETAGGNAAPSPSRPAIVNCLFYNVRDFEGVDCAAVDHCAFAPSAVNLSASLGVPAPAPVPVFDPSAYTLRDLFVGAATLPAGVNAGATLFTDWRLTFRTQGPVWQDNPAATGAISVFPMITGNGTPVSISFPSEILGSSGGGEGHGTGAPTPATGLPTGLSLGYDQAGTFVVGGTLPFTDGFGWSSGGTPFTTMHFILRQPPAIPMLFGVIPGGVAPHVAGSLAPSGVLASPMCWGGFQGCWFLDHLTYPLENYSMLIGGSGAGTLGGAHWSVPVSLGLPTGRADFVFQVAYIAPNGQPVLSDVQRCFLLM